MFDNHAKNIAGEGELGQASGTGGARRRLEHLAQPGPLRGLRGEGPRGAERAGPQGPNSIEKIWLEFWLEKRLEFWLEIPYTKKWFEKG